MSRAWRDAYYLIILIHCGCCRCCWCDLFIHLLIALIDCRLSLWQKSVRTGGDVAPGFGFALWRHVLHPLRVHGRAEEAAHRRSHPLWQHKNRMPQTDVRRAPPLSGMMLQSVSRSRQRQQQLDWCYRCRWTAAQRGRIALGRFRLLDIRGLRRRQSRSSQRKLLTPFNSIHSPSPSVYPSFINSSCTVSHSSSSSSFIWREFNSMMCSSLPASRRRVSRPVNRWR